MTHNLNTPNKQWLVYLNTLSSISGDDLTIKPDTRRNLLLEVSGNNNIFIKKGDTSYNLTNYIAGDASFSNVDVSVNLNPLILTGNLIQVGYDLSWELLGREIDGEASGDRSGLSVSLNDDGNIVAIGAPNNDGNGSSSGHTRVYKYNSYDASWILLGQDIDGDGSFVNSGMSVSLNSSGNIVAILSSTSTSIYKYNDISWVRMDVPITSVLSNNAVSLNSIGNIVAIGNPWINNYKGDIRVYKFNNVSWVPVGQIITGEASYEEFGFSISLNAAGNIVAAGSHHLAGGAGYVKIYSYNDVSWVPMGQKLIEGAVDDKYGWSVSLNDAGNIIAIGAIYNDGNGTNTGRVRVYKYDTIDILWKPLGQYIDGLASQLAFGSSVSLNSIGNIVAIGGSFKPHGYTKVYYYNDITWEPIGVTISGEATGDIYNADHFSIGAYSGSSVSLNSTGNILAIGAPLNDGNGYINDGYGGNSFNIGHVRIYNLTGKINSNNSNIGLPSKVWRNAYIRDISVTNISISGNMTIYGSISNVIQTIPKLNDISSSLGSATYIWQRAFIRDLSSISTTNGTNWPVAGPTGLTGPPGPTGGIGAAGPVGPTGPQGLAGALGVSLNATLTDISNFRITTNRRIYQNICGDISGDISWSAVNGYYGLAKDAYPSLNQQSNGVLAVSTWTVGEGANYFKSYWSGICWSPELMLFVAVATSDATGTNRVMTSINGKNWTVRTAGVEVNSWSSICWSPQLRLFVAVANNGSNRVMTSSDGITWIARPGAPQPHTWTDVCWSPELGLFVAVAYNRYNSVMISSDGITWINILDDTNNLFFFQWNSVCWTPELKLFVAVGLSRVMISQNGINWTEISLPSGLNNNNWTGVAWSGELGIFVAVANSGSNRVMTSPDGVNWTARYSLAYTMEWYKVCWSPHLRLFAAIGGLNEAAQFQRLMTSPDGITWTSRTIIGWRWGNICWSPELGIFACTTFEGWGKSATSSLKGRPPTSYNVFDSSFNRINENGTWDFSNINVTTLTVNNVSVNSDDRLKHNEVVITNGLDVIERLTPKFYQKTQVLLDASYNGDLSGHAWTYEAGLIAQEVLQISDLSYVVGGGDYYEQKYNLITQTQNNDLSANYYEVSNNYYELSNNYYEPSANNYEVINNLITQAYNLNYNSVFVYGLAAIKELHAKVKAKEISILQRQTIINNLITRIETLESARQDVSNNIL